MDEGARSKRRCVARKALVPSAIHYVGYVEDDETPEMIMHKFEELEKIKTQSKASGARLEVTNAEDPSPEAAASGMQAEDHNALDAKQLQEVFKATSIFSVKSVLGNNQVLMGGDRAGGSGGATGGGEDHGGSWSDGDIYSDDDGELLDELRGFWSDDAWDAGRKRSASRRDQPRRDRAPGGERRVRGAGRAAATAAARSAALVTHYSRGSHALIRRKPRQVARDGILQLRVPPPPLPLPWGRAVKPLLPPPRHPAAPAGAIGSAAAAVATGDAAGAGSGSTAAAPCNAASTAAEVGVSGSTYVEAPNLAELDVDRQLGGRSFQAVLINTGWERGSGAAAAEQQVAAHQPLDQSPNEEQQQQQQRQPQQRQRTGQQQKGSWQGRQPGQQGAAQPSTGTSTSSVAARLSRLPLPQLCPKGFVFIWAPKEHLADVVRLMYTWGFTYVENLTWVLLHPNHSILRLAYPITCRSHITLLIFRRENQGRDIELRHQRNPDVVFDCVLHAPGREWRVPVEVYSTLETLLPTGKGQFLELWAARGVQRPGWTHVAEVAGV